MANAKKVKNYTLLEEKEIMNILRSLELLKHLVERVNNRYSHSHIFQAIGSKLNEAVNGFIISINYMEGDIRRLSNFVGKEIYDTKPTKVKWNIKRDRILEIKILKNLGYARSGIIRIEKALNILEQKGHIRRGKAPLDESKKLLKLFLSVKNEIKELFKEEYVREKAELAK